MSVLSRLEERKRGWQNRVNRLYDLYNSKEGNSITLICAKEAELKVQEIDKEIKKRKGE